MISVGVTGNIGSGKTTVCQIFEGMGIPVIYADALAKKLMTERLHIRHFLLEKIGMDVFGNSGLLNRAMIAEKIFSQQKLKEDLEAVVHPAVKTYLKHWFEGQVTPYAIEEAALIFESGSNHFLNKVIFVHCPIDIRMQRVMARDQVSEDVFRQRESHQWPAEDKINQADYVIHNDGQQSLIQQVFRIHQELLKE